MRGEFIRAIRWAALATSGLLGVPLDGAAQANGNGGLISHATTNQPAATSSQSRIENYVSIGRGADGAKRYELRAKVFEKLTQGKWTRAGTFRVEKPVLTVFSKGESLLTITGDTGESDPQGVFVLTGNASIISSDGRYSIRTHSLRFFARRKRITTPYTVTITGPDITGKSLGMVLDCVDRRIELFGESQLSMAMRTVPPFLVEAMTALPQALDACTDTIANSSK
jgi:LPS export ABC transporter protein LptC